MLKTNKMICQWGKENFLKNKSILLTSLADNLTCFKLNALHLFTPPPPETKLNILRHFAYLVKVSWFKSFFNILTRNKTKIISERIFFVVYICYYTISYVKVDKGHK